MAGILLQQILQQGGRTVLQAFELFQARQRQPGIDPKRLARRWRARRLGPACIRRITINLYARGRGFRVFRCRASRVVGLDAAFSEKPAPPAEIETTTPAASASISGSRSRPENSVTRKRVPTSSSSGSAMPAAASGQMVRGVRGYALLDGYRGAPPADVPALEETLLRVSALVGNHPEIVEMDLNPVKVLALGKGCVAVDARIRLGVRP